MYHHYQYSTTVEAIFKVSNDKPIEMFYKGPDTNNTWINNSKFLHRWATGYRNKPYKFLGEINENELLVELL